MSRKKRAAIFCVIGLCFLVFGAINFELGGIDSMTMALAVATSLSLGTIIPIYGIYIMSSTEDNMTVNKGEKSMTKTKPKKELFKGNTSVDLMKKEKELESLLAEVKKQLIEKGWVQKDGSWGIE